jgi:hypothetical protein
MQTFKEFRAERMNPTEAHVQAKHFDTQEYDVLTGKEATNESVSPDPENAKRIIMRHDGEGAPKGVSGLSVPRHMWEGSKTMTGMAERNKARAEVYGSEHREPLSVSEMEESHKSVLDEHFAKPKALQIAHEKEAIGRLKAAKHLDSGSTTDESEKTDTILHEKDKAGRGYIAAACKGVAGHAVYTSGGGEHAQHRVVNTCPGQTRGCGGGVDAHGVANTTKGTCFAPNAEAQYPGASIRRAYLDQSKHDPKMTKDYILAHTHSIRMGAEKADKKDKNFVIRPNTLNENDRSTKHVVRQLNAQRATEGKSKIISYQYSKTNELNDPENGTHVTHSNIGPKVINGKMVRENVNRDSHRVNNTVTATKSSGEDLRNVQGNKTPAMHSYLVTNLPRGGAMDKEYQKHAKTIKYWDRGTKLSEDEVKSSPREGHFDGSGKPTTEDKAHHGFKVVGERKYEYQNQHILHPRMTSVNGHDIPSDSRFKDDEHMPSEATRFKSKNGKSAGGVVVTSATTSTSGERSNSSFTHRIDQHKLDKIKQTGVHEIDAPEEQEAARGKDYNGEEHAVPLSKIGGLKKAIKESDDTDQTVIVESLNLTKSAFTRGIKKIADMTDRNLHSEAIHAGAKLLGHAELAATAEHISKEHNRLGYLDTDLYHKRTKTYDALMDHAKKVLSPEDHQRFYMAY